MPLLEFQCDRCEGVLELFLSASDHPPRICGYRCLLESSQEGRGEGELRRILSVPGVSLRSAAMRDKPTESEIRRAGFTTFVNEGGSLKRSIGELGPRHISGEEGS